MSTASPEPTPRASPSGLPSGTTAGSSTSPPRCGATRAAKWSRQSEELPLHRVLDLAILTARACQFFREESYRHPEFYDPEHPVIDRVGLEGDAMTVSVCTENPMIGEDIKLFSQALSDEGERLGERFSVLARLLKEMGY